MSISKYKIFRIERNRTPNTTRLFCTDFKMNMNHGNMNDGNGMMMNKNGSGHMNMEV